MCCHLPAKVLSKGTSCLMIRSMKVELSFAWIDKSRYNNCAAPKALTEKIEGQGFYILRELQVIPFLLVDTAVQD